MLAPAWVQLRIGPWLRGGIDRRSYHRQILLMGLFRSSAYVHGAERRRLRGRAVRVAEGEWSAALCEPRGQRPVVIAFEGPGKKFRDYPESSQTLHHALRADTNSRWLELADRLAAPIAINVRCGNDFSVASSPDDYRQRGALKTPIEWFVETLRFVRALVGRDVPAVLVSDGTHAQVRKLLDEPEVRFARPGCAISDLLVLAQSRVLLGAGGSSFSAWGAFLSGAVTLTHPGQSLEWFGVSGAGKTYVGEFDPHGVPSPAVIESVGEALQEPQRAGVVR
jgi:hypothetical protein